MDVMVLFKDFFGNDVDKKPSTNTTSKMLISKATHGYGVNSKADQPVLKFEQ